MNPDQSVEIVGMLRKAYPRQKFNRENAQAYSAMLVDLDFQDAKRAVLELASTEDWMPSIAQIRKAALQVTEDSSESAWGKVQQLISRYGMYQTPESDDPVLLYAISCVGWKQLCQSDRPDVMRSYIVRAYREGQEKARRVENTGRLLDAHGVKRGLLGIHDEKKEMGESTGAGAMDVRHLLGAVLSSD